MRKFIAAVVIVATAALLSVQQLPAHGLPVPAARPDQRPLAPADLVALAAPDAAAVQNDPRICAAYLTLGHFPAEFRPLALQVLDGVCNHLSLRQRMAFVQPVAGANLAVVRVDLRSYGWTREGWDRLAEKGSGPVRVDNKEDQPEPYFQVLESQLSRTTASGERKRRKVSCAPYQADDGRVYDWKWEYYGEENLVAPWLDAGTYGSLQAATSLRHPILRADWFLRNAILEPAYSELQGLQTLADFQKAVRFHSTEEDLAGRAIVVKSLLVAKHPRVAEFVPTAIGTYWRTQDFKKATGASNLLKNPLSAAKDAAEIFAEGENGLQKYFLTDGKDKRIDFADRSVAEDFTGITGWNQHAVWGGLYSCAVCHQSGARDLNDEVRGISSVVKPQLVNGQVVTNPFAVAATLRNEKEVKDADRHADLFSKPIDARLQVTRGNYANAVAAATRGLTPKQFLDGMNRIFLQFEQQDMTLAHLAAETGCDVPTLQAILPRLKGQDPTLAQFDAGRPVRRDLWEELGYAQSAALVYQLRKQQPPRP